MVGSRNKATRNNQSKALRARNRLSSTRLRNARLRALRALPPACSEFQRLAKNNNAHARKYSATAGKSRARSAKQTHPQMNACMLTSRRYWPHSSSTRWYISGVPRHRRISSMPAPRRKGPLCMHTYYCTWLLAIHMSATHARTRPGEGQRRCPRLGETVSS